MPGCCQRQQPFLSGAPEWLILHMHYPFLVIAGLVVLTLACNEKKPDAPDKSTTTGQQDTSAAQPYFPLASFLRSEIQYVDSLPVGIKKYTTAGKQQDSGYIRLEEFHRLSAEFLSPEIGDSAFKTNFTETSFFDKSSNTATFLYTSKNQNTAVRRADVITAKGDIYDEVQSIYVEKSREAGDTTITKKMFWKPKRNFQIITLIAAKNEKPKNELVKVVWDNRE
jgi:hypothetical protein